MDAPQQKINRADIKTLTYVVSFQQSLRGLVPGAPVEYRGIQIGRVERLLLKEVSAVGLGDDRTNIAIPVLIYLEPGRLQIPDSEDSVSILRENIEQSVYDGMRATLQTGNLLTGRQLISFDFYPEEAPAELGQFEQYTTLPTIGTGLVQLETQVSDLLKKLNALPVEETVGGANKALASLATALDSANATLSSAGTAELSGELVLTLQKMRVVLDGFSNDAELYKSLNASLRSLDATLNNTTHLTRKLSDKPNAILLPTRTAPDLIPRAKDQ